mmetsp:Transcript_14059/g.43438  ORF Transcript_14059/g.43438 Transcript_14059/m.43438 type:complete len:210 (-) Transcript_14059:45-674(-)
MMSHLLAVLAIATTACGLVAPPRTPRTALVASPPTSRTSTALAAVAELAAAQVFGRLADKKLLLDVPGAGTPEMRDCCHGGCDNCDYSRVFDEMNAGKAKWVACYLTREHSDGRRHEAPLASIFGDDETLTADAFVERLADLEPKPTMGARPADVMAEFDGAGAAGVFRVLSRGEDAVDVTTFTATLQDLSGEAHGVPWKKFLAAVTSA